MYALIDCNNFYVSCERVFQPSLNDRAGCVLSNNDGCAIARSQEAKDLGIKMGTPFFEMRELHEQGKIWWRSSNYALYQEMMRRVTAIISDLWPEIEIYSIDECFCYVADYKLHDLERMARALRAKILKYTGIPVCVGIGPTKTLAKVANRIAKKQFKDIGAYVLNTPYRTEKALRDTGIGDVWGIGRKHAARLQNLKVTTAYDFTQLPGDWVQTNMTIVGLRTWKELRGLSCMEMEYERPDKKGISTSRSFGNPETELQPMEEALATYVANAALKLRDQNSVCASLNVFAHTSFFIAKAKVFSAAITIKLPVATNITSELIRHAVRGLRTIYKKGYRYQKVGVYLLDIRPAGQVQGSLFEEPDNPYRRRMAKAGKAIDKLNAILGKDVVRFASMGYDRKWSMKQQYLSKKYTTRLNDVIRVKAC